MIPLRKIFIVGILAALSTTSRAQSVVLSSDTVRKSTTLVVPKIKKPKPYHRELSFGLRINTNGWSLFGEQGRYKPVEERRPDDFFNARIYTVELSEKKHPREIKRRSDNQASQDERVRKFIFAKTNNFYALKLGYGMRRMIAGKTERGNVSVHWVYSGGLSLGMLKPYYVDAFVYKNGTWTEQSIKRTDSTVNSFMNAEAIIGRSSFIKGIGETKFIPGIHARLGIHFDFAVMKQNVLGLESGITGELYSKKIELMETQKAYPYTGNIYLSVQFGKRTRPKK